MRGSSQAIPNGNKNSSKCIKFKEGYQWNLDTNEELCEDDFSDRQGKGLNSDLEDDNIKT